MLVLIFSRIRNGFHFQGKVARNRGMHVFPHAAQAGNVSLPHRLCGGESPLRVFVMNESASGRVEKPGVRRYYNEHVRRNALTRLRVFGLQGRRRRHRVR
jgi:hypothetical protein